MKMFKKVVLGAAMALAFSGAQASLINVGGISWDPDDTYPDFGAATSTMRQFIDPSTGVLSGFGIINTLNGSSTFAGAGELTFQFGGFTPTGLPIPTTSGQTLTYGSGWVKVYADFSVNPADRVSNPTNYNTLTLANTGNGLLWLSLIGHADSLGTTFSGLTTPVGGVGLGQLDVNLADNNGGAAGSNFDTNSQFDSVNLIPTWSGADVILSSAFNKIGAGPAGYLSMQGSANFTGNTIPEPASLVLVGLGLVGAAVLRRRKAAK